MSRSLNRSILKKQYERFCQAWNNEKRYQQYALTTGKAEIKTSDMKGEDGRYVQQIVEGDEVRNLLGRKPTFAMWLNAVNNKKIAADVHKQPIAEGSDPKKVNVEDADWD